MISVSYKSPLKFNANKSGAFPKAKDEKLAKMSHFEMKSIVKWGPPMGKTLSMTSIKSLSNSEAKSEVKVAVIPAAGLGTRFLPATKTVPKEMLTLFDAPIILFVVEEAVQAGIEDIVLIQGRGKTAIEDFFDNSYELEDRLAKDGKSHLLDRVRAVRDKVNIISIRQKQPSGLGHAVLCSQSIVGQRPFAVLLGDEIMLSSSVKTNTTAQLIEVSKKSEASCVAVMPVEASEVSKYGIADVEKSPESEKSGLYKVKAFVEKPKAELAPSRLALPGRYVFQPQIFDFLKMGKPGLNGEIQLTDSMNAMAKTHPFFAATFAAKRFDAGDKLGYLKANIEIALQSSDIGLEFKKYLLSLAKELH
jgi:UTP--glucose-1-phosphate uridylyltransferase